MRVLIVKLSSLGDVVHAMAAVQDIIQSQPNAVIDWVVESSFAPLLSRVQGIHRIIVFGQRAMRKQLLQMHQWPALRQTWRAFMVDLQQDAYDLVIDLQGLTKSALVLRMARLRPNGRRIAMANATDGSSYEAPTRWLATHSFKLPKHTHAVQRSRQLCALALDYSVPTKVSFGLKASQNAPAVHLPEHTVMLAHGCSRADKSWPLAHWHELGARLIESGHHLVVAQANDAEATWTQALKATFPSSAQDFIIVLPRLDVAQLTDVMAQCSGVIGVDSGISHIAVALDLPHVQIYNFDTAWRTGPIDTAHQLAIVGHPTPSVDSVWAFWEKAISARHGSIAGLT